MAVYWIRMLRSGWLRLLTTFLVLTAGFYVIDTAWSIWDGNTYVDAENRRMLAVDPEAAGQVIMGHANVSIEEREAMYRSFLERMKAIPEIDLFGCYIYGTTIMLDTGEMVPDLRITGDILRLGRLSFAEGSEDEVNRWLASPEEDGPIPALVGFDLAESMPLGTEFNCPDLEGVSKKYVVRGILKQGSKWFAQNTPFVQSSAFLLLDNVVILPVDMNPQSVYSIEILNMIGAGNIFYTAHSREAFPETHGLVSQALAQTGNVAMNGQLEKEISDREQMLLDSLGRQRQFALFISLVVCLYLSTSILLGQIRRKKEYGIAGSIGISFRSFHLMSCMETMIMTVLGLAAAYAVRERECMSIFTDSGGLMLSFVAAHHAQTLPRMILTAFVILVISLTVSWIWLRKQNVVELMRELG